MHPFRSIQLGHTSTAVVRNALKGRGDVQIQLVAYQTRPETELVVVAEGVLPTGFYGHQKV